MEIKDEIFKLKSRLESGKDEKIAASLQRLKKLPVDLDLLLDTGIGKTVNKLRHHEVYGDFARKLVAKWKECAHEMADEKGIEYTQHNNHQIVNNKNNIHVKNGHHSNHHVAKQQTEEKRKNADDSGSSMNSTVKPCSLKDFSRNAKETAETVKPKSWPEPPLANHGKHHKTHKPEMDVLKKDKNSAKVNMAVKEENFTSNCGSFEDVLGLNDRVSTKKISTNNSTTHKALNDVISKVGHHHHHHKSKGNSVKGKAQKSEVVADDVTDRRCSSTFDEIDWSKVLPKTDPVYRPQHLPTDYSEYTSNNAKKRSAAAVDETDQNLFSSKKDRNKVFSGRRVNYLSTVPRLYDSCMRVLCDNIDGLGYTGGVPYDILKPILERATAEQLFRLEDLNPYLVEDTDGLWESLCRKDFRNAEREELESWREVYERLLLEREKKLEKVKHNITASKSASGPVRQAKLAVAKAPRDVLRRQIKYGTVRQAVPTVEEIVQSRRNIEAHPEDRTKIVCRPASTHYEAEVAQKKKKPRVAPLMAKTLKMLKMARR